VAVGVGVGVGVGTEAAHPVSRTKILKIAIIKTIFFSYNNTSFFI